MQTYHLYESDKPQKKFYVEFVNPDTGREKKVYFGGIKPNGLPYEAFIDHKDEDRKANYIRRHQAREDWNNLNKAGTWSRYILWGEPTMRASIKNMEKMFDIRIIKKKK
jgi:hypothetical protein